MTTIRAQVRAFHEAMSVPSPAAPTVPDAATVRLRARLIAEEFCETMAALYPRSNWDAICALLMSQFDGEPSPDMIGLADGLADLDYVVEGTRQAFGIDGAPIAAEVHRSNMAKLGGPKDANGKIRKPDGWLPPDVAGELRAQGWRP